MVDLMKKDKNTEARILNAAKDVFIEKGFSGARMQEIADKAEINKSMLHYYFRTKEKLLYNIFEMVLNDFFPIISDIVSSNAKLEDKIRQICKSYISILQKNPYMPLFIISEISRNPEKLKCFVQDNLRERFELIKEVFFKQIKEEKLRQIDATHIIMNIISLSVFHFAAMPLFKALFEFNDNEYAELLEERKEIVGDTITSWLKNMG